MRCVSILRELGKQAAQLGLHFRSHTYSVGASFVHQSSKSSAIRSVSPADCLAISPVLQRGSIWRFLSRRSSQNYKYTLSDEVARDVQQAKEGKPREFWHGLSPVQQAVGSLIGINVVIFGLFKIPSLYYFMVQNFLHHLPPLPSKSITLLTSNFAHANPWHILFNMVALWSFGREAARILGVEQFMGFYISAGLMSALASHLGRARSIVGGFSMGASGAVYACFALTAMHKPDTEVVFILLPWLPLKIGDVLNVMIALDLAGAVLGWKRFDHLGHLGGALFGLYYALRGQQEVWPKFQQLADNLIQGGKRDY